MTKHEYSGLFRVYCYTKILTSFDEVINQSINQPIFRKITISDGKFEVSW